MTVFTKQYMDAVRDSWTDRRPLTPQTARMLRTRKLKMARIQHIMESVLDAFSQQHLRTYHRRVFMGQFKTGQQIATSRNLSMFLRIHEMCSSENIKLVDFMKAQFDTLASGRRVFYLTLCSGPNALQRYRNWEGRQRLKVTHKKDRESKAFTSDFYKAIKHHVYEGHKWVIQNWQEQLQELDPPSVGFALAYVAPCVSQWYLIAHPESRGLMLNGLWPKDLIPTKRLDMFKNDIQLKQACNQGLSLAEDEFGKLEI